MTYDNFISQFEILENPPVKKGFHRHHIVPRSEQMEPDERQVYLLPSQHLWAHILYDRENGTNTASYLISASQIKKEDINSFEDCILFDERDIENQKKNAELNTGEKNGFYGKHHSAETLDVINQKRKEYWSDDSNHKKHSERLKGNTNASGHILPEESKKTILQKNQEYWAKDVNKQEASKRSKLNWQNEDYRKRISESNRLRTQSPDFRKKHSEQLKGRHLYNNGVVTIMSFECPGPEWKPGRLKKEAV